MESNHPLACLRSLPPLMPHPNLDPLCLSSLMGGVFLPGGGVVLEADYLQVVLMEQ